MAIVTRALQPYPHSCYYIRCSLARHKRRSRCPGHSLKTVPDRRLAYSSGALPCTTSRRELEILLIQGLHPRRSTSEGGGVAGGSYANKNERATSSNRISSGACPTS